MKANAVLVVGLAAVLVVGLAAGFAVGLAVRLESPGPTVGEVSAARVDPTGFDPLRVSHVTFDGQFIPVAPDGPPTGKSIRVDVELDGRHLTVWVQE